MAEAAREVVVRIALDDEAREVIREVVREEIRDLVDQANRGLKLLDEEQAADLLGISVRSLQDLRYSGRIPYLKFGRRPMYRISDLEKWLDQETVQPVRMIPQQDRLPAWRKGGKR